MKAVEEVLDDALFAFWDMVAKAYPEATSGDFHPVMQALFKKAAITAMQHWVDLNVPKEKTT